MSSKVVGLLEQHRGRTVSGVGVGTIGLKIRHLLKTDKNIICVYVYVLIYEKTQFKENEL